MLNPSWNEQTNTTHHTAINTNRNSNRDNTNNTETTYLLSSSSSSSSPCHTISSNTAAATTAAADGSLQSHASVFDSSSFPPHPYDDSISYFSYSDWNHRRRVLLGSVTVLLICIVLPFICWTLYNSSISITSSSSSSSSTWTHPSSISSNTAHGFFSRNTNNHTAHSNNNNNNTAHTLSNDASSSSSIANNNSNTVPNFEHGSNTIQIHYQNFNNHNENPPIPQHNDPHKSHKDDKDNDGTNYCQSNHFYNQMTLQMAYEVPIPALLLAFPSSYRNNNALKFPFAASAITSSFTTTTTATIFNNNDNDDTNKKERVIWYTVANNSWSIIEFQSTLLYGNSIESRLIHHPFLHDTNPTSNSKSSNSSSSSSSSSSSTTTTARTISNYHAMFQLQSTFYIVRQSVRLFLHDTRQNRNTNQIQYRQDKDTRYGIMEYHDDNKVMKKEEENNHRHDNHTIFSRDMKSHDHSKKASQGKNINKKEEDQNSTIDYQQHAKEVVQKEEDVTKKHKTNTTISTTHKKHHHHHHHDHHHSHSKHYNHSKAYYNKTNTTTADNHHEYYNDGDEDVFSYHAIIQEITINSTSDFYDILDQCRCEMAFEGPTSGFKGAVGLLGMDGIIYILALCDANHCSEKKRNDIGNGKIVLMRKKKKNMFIDSSSTFPPTTATIPFSNHDEMSQEQYTSTNEFTDKEQHFEECIWETIRIIDLPKSAYFLDYSDMDITNDGKIIISTQQESALWIGRLKGIDKGIIDPNKVHFDKDEKGIILSFPKSDSCCTKYCNIEGVKVLNERMIIAVSGLMQGHGRQDFRCFDKQQSIHVFILP